MFLWELSPPLTISYFGSFSDSKSFLLFTIVSNEYHDIFAIYIIQSRFIWKHAKSHLSIMKLPDDSNILRQLGYEKCNKKTWKNISKKSICFYAGLFTVDGTFDVCEKRNSGDTRSEIF